MPHCLWNLPWLSKRNHPHLYIPLTKYYWPSWCQVHFQELGTFQWIKPGPCLKEVAFQWDDIVQFSHSVVSDSLQSHESQHTRPACPSPTPRVHPNSCASSQWCYPAISSSGIPFSCPQSLPASGSFPMSQLFTWGGQSIGVSALASVLPMNTQDWSPLGGTGWTSWKSSQP